jgi:hypothetical protein
MEESFEALKERFPTAQILTHFDLTKPCIVETDVSYFTLGALRSHQDEDIQLHPIAFHSPKFQLAEINYEVHDKELLAVLDSFKV